MDKRRREILAGLAAAGVLPLIACGSDAASSQNNGGAGSAGQGGGAGTAGQGGGAGSAGQGGGADAGVADANGSNDGSADGSVSDGKSRVFIVESKDRVKGLEALLAMTGLSFAKNRDIAIKPNYCCALPYPTTTHNDTLATVVSSLRNAGCKDITLGESVGSGQYDSTWAALKIKQFCEETLKIGCVDFDSMPAEEWSHFTFDGIQWPGGLSIPKLLRSDKAVVTLPLCKTHDYGGVFTMSLKLAVGIAPLARRVNEMHYGVDANGIPNASKGMGKWIADINYGYTPDLIVMDAMQPMIAQGPGGGPTAEANLLLASNDRIAMDAVGLAILTHFGSTVLKTSGKKIFEQDQIARAVELGLGAKSPDEIVMVGDSTTLLSKLRSILDVG